jgi:hypothetical protein
MLCHQRGNQVQRNILFALYLYPYMISKRSETKRCLVMIFQGDNGGPLTFGSGSGLIQIAVASFGSCGGAHPDGYTRVSSLRTWLNSVAGV